jgi:hypothetical protein
MKKLLFILLIPVFGLKANAQTEKGGIMVGGSIQFQSSEGESIFAADPNIGFFLANNIAAGAQLQLVSNDGTTFWGIGPYLRGYIGKSAKGKPFAQAGVNFAGVSDGGGSSTAFQGKLGYAAFLTRNVALEIAGNILAGEGATLVGLGIGFQIHLK